jgi:hypothetical protein
MEAAIRLKTDFWVSAYLRRCDVEGVVAVLRRRGAAEAGAVYVKLDHLDGRAALFGPAPSTEQADRVFMRLHKDEWIEPADAEARLRREIAFDADIWIVEIEDRAGNARIDLVGV